jgi:uncharacterized protein YlaN (UPF0358 family)
MRTATHVDMPISEVARLMVRSGMALIDEHDHKDYVMALINHLADLHDQVSPA